MDIQSLKKKLGAAAAIAAKKAGDQVLIARLGIEKAGLEKRVDEAFLAIGKYCYTQARTIANLPKEIEAYCVDIDVLREQILELEEEIAAQKVRSGIKSKPADEAVFSQTAPAPKSDGEADGENEPGE